MYINENNITIEDSAAFKQLKKISGMSESKFSQKIFDLIQGKMNCILCITDLTDQDFDVLDISVITKKENWNPQKLTNELMKSTNNLTHSILLSQIAFIEHIEPAPEPYECPDLKDQGQYFGLIGF